MFGLLVLGGCGNFAWHPGPIGRAIDPRPPTVTVVDGSPSGALIGGGAEIILPEGSADRVVAEDLRSWLSVEERRSLAVASQRAATAPAAAAIDWQSHDGSDEVTAHGDAVALGAVFRSLRGEICRDIRQSVQKNEALHADTVTLCRETVAAGTVLWVSDAG